MSPSDQQLISHYAQLWRLEISGDVKRTHSSIVVPVMYQNSRAMLKMVHREGAEEQNAAKLLTYWNGKGAVKLLRNDDQAMLIERAEDDTSLEKMVVEDRDDDATKILAGVIRNLHETKGEPPSGLIPLSQWFRALFAKAEKKEDVHAGFYGIAARMAKELLTNPRDITVLHGDIHHENVLHSSRGWLAIDPKGLLGERIYDAVNILCNPHSCAAMVHDCDRMARQAGILAEVLNLDQKRLLDFAFVHACVSVCWSEEDGQDTAYGIKSMETAGYLVGIV